MEVRVRFRFNKVTGEVELFEVLDEGTMRLPEAEHNRQHDRIAAEVGNVIERDPRVTEVFPGAAVPAVPVTTPGQPGTDDAATEPIADREKRKQS